MFRTLLTYFWGCLRLALRGSLNNALNWAGIIGVGIVGAFREMRGSAMSDPHTWQSIVGWTALYTAVAWAIIFTVRLLIVAPFQLFREQKERADRLDGLRQAASDVSRSPSFDIGFEYQSLELPTSEELTEAEGRRIWVSTYTGHFDKQDICRIWVENLEPRPIFDCRVVLEYFGPESPVKNGVSLLPDHRGADEEPNARFDLSATERKYMKFLALEVPLLKETLSIVLKTDQARTGIIGVFDKHFLSFEREYFATIAVHGKEALSRRINLTIKTDPKAIVVFESVGDNGKTEVMA